MQAFTAILVDKDIDPETTPVSALEEDAVVGARLHSKRFLRPLKSSICKSPLDFTNLPLLSESTPPTYLD
jgi:hypothetical protein